MGQQSNEKKPAVAKVLSPSHEGEDTSRLSLTAARGPIGTAPAGPRWPLVLAALAWVAWIGILIALLVSKGGGTAA